MTTIHRYLISAHHAKFQSATKLVQVFSLGEINNRYYFGNLLQHKMNLPDNGCRICILKRGHYMALWCTSVQNYKL